jgi:hypothetical protein
MSVADTNDRAGASRGLPKTDDRAVWGAHCAPALLKLRGYQIEILV